MIKSVCVLDHREATLGDMIDSHALWYALRRVGFEPHGAPIDLTQDSLVVLGGGGTIIGRPDDANPLYRQLSVAQSAGIPTAVVGAGFQPFESTWEVAQWAQVLHSCCLAVVRDKLTQRQLSLWDIESTVLPPLAYLYPFGVNRNNRDRNRLLVALRTYSVDCLENAYNLVDMSDFTSILVVPFDERDQNDMGKYLGGRDIRNVWQNPAEALRLYTCSACAITHRFHGLLSGIVTHTPTFVIGKGVDKINQEIEAVGGDQDWEWAVEQTMEMDELWLRWLSFQSRLSDVTEQFIEWQRIRSREAMAYFDVLFNLYDDV